jgi:voltage-gated potassium channel
MFPEPQRRIAVGLAVFLAILVVATGWYWLIAGFSIVDALYQTIITVSTVGFSEVRPLDPGDRAFTILVIITGVGAGFYTFTGLFEYVIGRQIGRLGRRRLEQTIEKLHGHAIVCGYGRIGSKVADLIRPQMRVVVIEENADHAAEAREDGFLVVLGDATDDDVIREVHLEHAAILVAALPTDADNLYVALTGRSVNPDLHIVSRAQHAGSGAKLIRAGADRVVNPEDIGAQRLAAFALRPNVSEFLDVVMHGGSIEYRLEEFVVKASSPLVGLTLAEAKIRNRTGVTLLALKPPDGEISTDPPDDARMVAGTTLIAFGTREDLEAMTETVG